MKRNLIIKTQIKNRPGLTQEVHPVHEKTGQVIQQHKWVRSVQNPPTNDNPGQTPQDSGSQIFQYHAVPTPVSVDRKWIKPVESEPFSHNPVENQVLGPSGQQRSHWIEHEDKKYLVKYENQYPQSPALNAHGSSVVNEFVGSMIGRAIGVPINKVFLSRDPQTDHHLSVHEEIPNTKVYAEHVMDKIDQYGQQLLKQYPYSAIKDFPDNLHERTSDQQDLIDEYSSKVINQAKTYDQKLKSSPQFARLQTLAGFIGNYDRHNGNTLVDQKGQMHLIDTGMSNIGLRYNQFNNEDEMGNELQTLIDNSSRHGSETLRAVKHTLHKLGNLPDSFFDQLGQYLPKDAQYPVTVNPDSIVVHLKKRRNEVKRLYVDNFGDKGFHREQLQNALKQSINNKRVVRNNQLKPNEIAPNVTLDTSKCDQNIFNKVMGESVDPKEIAKAFHVDGYGLQGTVDLETFNKNRFIAQDRVCVNSYYNHPDTNAPIYITRRFERDPQTNELVVNHTELKIHSSLQGQGIGSQMYDQQDRLYKKLGVDKVTLIANMEVGGYMWALKGYQFTNPHLRLPELIDRFHQTIRNLPDETLDPSNKMTPEERHDYKEQHCSNISHYTEPWQFAQFTLNDTNDKEITIRRTQHPVLQHPQIANPDAHYHIGKSLMLGSAWDGFKNLKDDKGSNIGKLLAMKENGSPPDGKHR